MEFSFPVFPCEPNGKRPLVAGWQHVATNNPVQIETWQRHFPGCNWARPTAGLCVIDIDPKSGGDDSWAAWTATYGDPPDTQIVYTPSGGQHIYFTDEGEPVANGTHKLGPGIDVRGTGGYVLIPTSTIDGRQYRYADGTLTPAPIPGTIRQFVGTTRRERAEVPRGPDDYDAPADIARAKRYLERCIREGDVAVEGQGGDNRTYRLGAYLGDLGLSLETAIDLARDWNEACEPPWTEEDFAFKLGQGYESRQNDLGDKATPDPNDVFQAAISKLAKPKVHGDEWRLWRVHELTELPEPTWLIEDLIPKPAVGTLWGASGSGKTFVAIAQALDLARSGVRTAFMAGEGKRAVLARAKAWQTVHEFDAGDLFRVFDTVPYLTDGSRTEAMIQAFERQGFKPDLLVIDTTSRLMRGLDQNSDKDAGQLIEWAEGAKRLWDCTVLLIHHTGKDASRGERGSSVLRNDVDFSLEAEGEEPHLTRVHVRKQKEAAKGDPITYHGQPALGTLVYGRIAEREYRELTQAQGLDPRDVGEALAILNARGNANGVTTHVLAHHLAGPEASDEQIESWERSLGAAAKFRLRGYVLGSGDRRRWSLPG